MTRGRLAALAITVCPVAAAAQTAVPSDDRGGEPALYGTAIAEGPAGSADNTINGVDFNFEISGDVSKSSVQVGGYRVRNSSADGRARQLGQSWTVKLSAPIGGSDDLASRSMLDALANGPELSFTYSWLGFGSANIDSEEYRALTGPGGEVQTRCLAVSGEVGRVVGYAMTGPAQQPEALLRQRAREAARQVTPAAPDTVVSKAIDAALAARARGEDFRAAAVAAAEQEADNAEAPPRREGACVPPGPPETAFAKRYSERPDSEINRMVFSAGWRLGVEGGVGIDRFEFIDPATLDKRDPSKVQFRAALFGGYYPASGRTALLGRVEYQNAFEAADAGIVCRPVVVDPDTDCVPGVPTPPTNFERVNLSAEVRHIFETGLAAGDIASSPKLTYDTLSNEFSAVLPVYLVPRKRGIFAPGVSAAYSSLTDKVSFGVFMRSSF